MIWSVAEQIAKLSEAFELKAGDIIYSGTPENVGPVVKGDVLLCKLDGLPDMSIRIVIPRRSGADVSLCLLARQIRKFRMLAQIVHDKAATGDDLVSVGADQFQRALHQF